MIKVNSKKSLARLSLKSLKANKGRNIIAICAIILTTIMFTSLFTIGMSLLDSMQQSTFRQIGSSSHGTFKYLTQEQYEVLLKHPLIREASYNIIVGKTENKELDKLNIEVRYSEEACAKWDFAYPTEGQMPKAYDEVAMDTAVLDQLGVSHKVGERITLKLKIGEKSVEETFTLCGFWQADIAMPAHEVWLSKAYVDENVPKYTANTEDMTGCYTMEVWLHQSRGIEQKLNQIITGSGYEINEIETGINWGYVSEGMAWDVQTILMLAVVLTLIISAGYLIIYNIFYIVVTSEIRYYGLLKTIGTTTKQIKWLVRREALSLSCIGIPIGLLIGYLVGRVLAPYVLKITTIESYSIAFNPWIFIGSAIFSLITVMISYKKPCQVASKVSPMEALRYQEVRVKKKKQKSSKVNTFTMAKRNLVQNKKKLFVVTLSLSLSLILLNSIYSMIKGFDMDAYLKDSILADISIAQSSLITQFRPDYISNEDLQAIYQMEGIESSDAVYWQVTNHALTEQGKEVVQRVYKDRPDVFEGKYVSQETEDAQNKGEVPAFIYGIHPKALENFEVIEGELKKDKFESGEYVIVSPIRQLGNPEYTYYNPEDEITLTNQKGESKTYKVMMLSGVPKAIYCGYSTLLNFEVILPESEYRSFYGESLPIHVELNAEAGQEASLEQVVAHYCKQTSLKYTSKATLAESFKGLQMMYQVVGGGLSFILALIGILNFANTMITSILNRKRQLAIMQSIGMTGKQLKETLMLEGLLYATLTAGITLTIGLGINYFIVKTMAGSIWFFKYHFSILPICLCLPILVVIALIIPHVGYCLMRKESVVERIKE